MAGYLRWSSMQTNSTVAIDQVLLTFHNSTELFVFAASAKSILLATRFLSTGWSFGCTSFIACRLLALLVVCDDLLLISQCLQMCNGYWVRVLFSYKCAVVDSRQPHLHNTCVLKCH